MQFSVLQKQYPHLRKHYPTFGNCSRSNADFTVLADGA